MKKIPLILIILTFLGCNKKEKYLNSIKTETKTELTEKEETIFWVDTISNGKFLKIYSKPQNDWQNLTAEFGTSETKHKIDLNTEEYEMLGIPFTNQIEWITKKSFALINGCGTNCRYALIFNVENEKPIITRIDYYPGMNYGGFEIDNDSLYVKVNHDFGKFVKLEIIDTDTQNKNHVNLPKHWNRGSGDIYALIDEIKIQKSEIKIVQKYEDNRFETQTEKLVWE